MYYTRLSLWLAAAFLGAALFTTNANAQSSGQPVFPGFPNPNNPAAQGSGGAVYTPFNPLSTINPNSTIPNYGNAYGGGYPSYYPPPYTYISPLGSRLYGTAAVIESEGKFYMNQETAQIIRQKALQEQLQTMKMKFDLDKYFRENTPTWTENQIKQMREVLKRVLVNATPAEIWNGDALNVLLKDLKAQDLDQYPVKSRHIDEKTLRQVNVTFGNNGNLGILRNNGQFDWPLALMDEELLPEKTRLDINVQAKELVAQAANGSINVNAYKDLKRNIETVRENLTANVLNLDTDAYLQAKRFLNHFDQSLYALQETKVAEAQLQWQEFAKGGKTVQEIVDKMETEGWRFGPSNPGDEAAYDAVYSALANFDILFNRQLVSGKKK